MTVGQQFLDCGTRTAHLVRDNGAELALLRSRIKQYRRTMAQLRRRRHHPVEHRGVHDPVDMPISQRLQLAFLQRRVTAGGQQQQQRTHLRRRILRAEDHLPGKRRGDDAV